MTDPQTGPGEGVSPTVPGHPVTVRWRKWRGDPHWVRECVWLGSDEHGAWVGQRRGATSARPRLESVTATDAVALVDPNGEWVAIYCPPDHPQKLEIYIDLGHLVGWSPDEPGVLTGIDMDLDVIRVTGRETWIDDEDEFAEHNALWSYPPEGGRGHDRPATTRAAGRCSWSGSGW